MQSQNTSASGAFSLAVELENAGEIEGYNFTLIQKGTGGGGELDTMWYARYNLKIDDEIIDNSIFDTSGPDTKQFTGYNLYISTQAFADTDILNISASSDKMDDAQVYAPGADAGTTINVNEVEVARSSQFSADDFTILDESKVTKIDSHTICILITEGCTIEIVQNFTG